VTTDFSPATTLFFSAIGTALFPLLTIAGFAEGLLQRPAYG
jgi:hypothetical protein